MYHKNNYYICKQLLNFLIILCLISNNYIFADSGNSLPLKFNSDGTFKIVQFTDLHYGERDDWDELNRECQEKIIEVEQPDFVMLSGDMITGYKPFFKNITNYYTTWDAFTLPMRKRNIPWSVTYGNHDDEGKYNRWKLNSIDMNYNLSLTQNGPSSVSGVANYVLEILPSTVNKSQSAAAALIYIFDSVKSKTCNQQGSQWGCIDDSQIQWYVSMSEKYNKTPGFAYVHVPPFEVIDQWNTKNVYGDFGEKFACCFYTHNSNNNNSSNNIYGNGLVQAMIERGDIRSLYYGHDHKNDYHGDYYGIDMGYSRKSGYGSYDPKYMQGARVLKVYEKTLTHDTWIRTMDGNIDNQDRHTPLDKVPEYCCVPADSSPEFSWSIYFGVFCGVMICLFFIYWRLTTKKNNRSEINYTRVQMSDFQPDFKLNPTINV